MANTKNITNAIALEIAVAVAHGGDVATECEAHGFTPDQFAEKLEKMLATARKPRNKGERGETPEQRLSVTLSTRKIVQWAKLARRYQGASCPLKESLELLLMNRCAPAERFAIDTMGKIIFNDGWKTDAENA